ncbi:hypothetical protein [Deinococcus aquatilis]|uniref:hypothetical protein n=1 Tax=Deinococcus aquatilis TaxID=519440 RepID=UPI00035F3B2C|nr:hypothetical protein [Deinococcus aquatilis]
MAEGTLEIVWLMPEAHVVNVMLAVDQDELGRPLQVDPDPHRVWTLSGLLRSPPPRFGSPVTLRLQRATGGNWGMVTYRGRIYLSEWAKGQPPIQADMDHALRLGWMGPIAPLLLSWEQQGH